MNKQTINAIFAAGFACLIAAAPTSAELFDFVQAAPMPALNGLAQASSVVVSPDGVHVYVAAGRGDAIVAFSRDADTGELSEIQALVDNTSGIDGLDDAGSITISPDGAHVYSTSTRESAVAVFSRDAGSGLLTFVEAEFEGVGGVQGLEAAHMATVSPDGAHVYVAAPGDAGGTPAIPGRVSLFERNALTGELTFINSLTDDLDGVLGLSGVVSVVISPDGAQAYTAAFRDEAVAVFDRDITTGVLSFKEVHVDGVGVDGLDGVNELAVSSNGANVYAVSIERFGDGENALATFNRNTSDGTLTFTDVQFEGVAGVEGLIQPSSVVLDPSDRFIFATGVTGNSLVIFTRDASTGLPSFAEAEFDGINGVDGLGFARWVELSPDGSHIYVAGLSDAKIAVFALPLPAIIPVLGPWGLASLGGLLALLAAFVRRRSRLLT